MAKSIEERRAWIELQKQKRAAKFEKGKVNYTGSSDFGEFTSEIPDVIKVDASMGKKKMGQPSKETSRLIRRKGGGGPERTWYSDAKKMEAACVYAVTGNSRRVEEITKIPEGTIRAWKTTEWWNEIISRVHQEANDELDSKLSKMIDKAVDNINDRLENGDYIYNAHQDKLVRKPVGAKEVASITAMAIDKRQLLRGEPTSRVQKVSENEKLVRLAEQFKSFVMAKEIESTAVNIEEGNYSAETGEVAGEVTGEVTGKVAKKEVDAR